MTEVNRYRIKHSFMFILTWKGILFFSNCHFHVLVTIREFIILLYSNEGLELFEFHSQHKIVEHLEISLSIVTRMIVPFTRQK